MDGSIEWSQQRPHVLQNLTYLLSGPLQKKFAEPCYSETCNASLTLGLKEIKSQTSVFLLTTFGNLGKWQLFFFLKIFFDVDHF